MDGFRKCSSCEALYTKSCACSKGGFIDKFIRDPNKTPDSSQRPPHDCPKCGSLVDGLHCRQCALLRKILKEVLFTICDEHKFFQDFLNTSESSNDDSNVVNMPQEPFVFNQDPGENSSQSPPQIDHHCCCGCGNSLDRIFCQRCTYQVVNLDSYSPKTLQCRKIPLCYDDDDDEESATPMRDIIIYELPPCIAITTVLSTKETKDSLIMGDEHLDTITEKESDEFIKSSVENLVPNPSESENKRECDVPGCDDFTTFSNLLFDADDNFSSSDDKSFSDEDIPKEIYSNPLFDEEIISIKIDPHHFNVESGINSDYSDFERDNLFPERLLHDDPGPLLDILDFLNVVRIFPPLFTYPVTSLILLSSGSKDTIFDTGISNYHFSSLEQDVSHRSETFKKFNVYPNHLNESLMEILSSTCSPIDQ
nr:hypothetical protein [Tanacetum cinerariifolium]